MAAVSLASIPLREALLSTRKSQGRDSISRDGGSLDYRTREAPTGGMQLLKVSSWLVTLSQFAALVVRTLRGSPVSEAIWLHL